jgi:hypothetical protein
MSVGTVLNPYLALMSLHDTMSNGQAHAKAGLDAGAKELLKNLVAQLRRDARALVGDGKTY